MTSTKHLDLREIDACLFDVFGTVLNWHSTVTRQVACLSKGLLIEGSQNAIDFAEEWRAGYFAHVKKVARGGEGTFNADIMHREILDDMLATPRWSYLAEIWGESNREELTMIWHNLDAFQDTIPGLTELKRHVYILALSNGNFKLLLDLAKNQSIPWDGIFSSEMFGSYKPNKQVYQSAAYHLSLPPHKIAMVAAHKFDLLAAASVGFKTIYVPRPAEDSREVRESMRSRKDGGEVDLVVKDFHELARLMGEARQS
ncbi:HAD-like domain-containing protein [Suillus clintonianus]|uniref:HAD-like domain-containing protein n=1 Tax=Suillus clintonianus TaxID=1904413 RepID=UPI001B869E76|nr:HAD-like domain-containing protein [Suillus clintonianus]KAG2113230.1 HAD-like domain-containing protein [Suillus clintonianus]